VVLFEQAEKAVVEAGTASSFDRTARKVDPEEVPAKEVVLVVLVGLDLSVRLV